MKLILGLTIYSNKRCFYHTVIIRKLLETFRNRLQWFLAGFRIFLSMKFFEKMRKPAGNRRGCFPEVSSWFRENSSMTDHVKWTNMKPYNNGTLVYTINFVTSYTYQKAHFCFSTYYIDTFLSQTSLFFPNFQNYWKYRNNEERDRKVNQSSL